VLLESKHAILAYLQVEPFKNTYGLALVLQPPPRLGREPIRKL